MSEKIFLKSRLPLWIITFIILVFIHACGEQDEPYNPLVNEYSCDTDGFTEVIRFGVCADVHQDYVYQVPQKMRVFIDEMNKENVDFIIQLGDFCFPKDANNAFLEVWDSFNGAKYHVIGNHDCEISSKQVFMDYVGYPSDKAYYSFNLGGFHFVILDLNFGLKDGELIPYSNNYGRNFESCNYINEEQYNWLENDLKGTNKRTIIFSHQPIYKGLQNPERFYEIMKKENALYKKVVVAFSGHNHQDWMVENNRVQHCQINSMCYNFCGIDCQNESRFSPEVYKAYPVMRYMFPYEDPLFAIVELDPANGTVSIIGRNSDFILPAPVNLGFSSGISSRVTNRTIKYKF